MAGTTFSGAMSGGFGSVMAGGNFWEGARNGAISAGLNHAMHAIQQNVATKKLISNMEQAIEAQREAMLRYFSSDPDNPTHQSFDSIDFNIGEYVYKKGLFSYKSATQYKVNGSLTINGSEILFNGLFYARPDNYVTYIENLGTTAGYGFLVKNAFFFKGSGIVMRVQIPDNYQYQLLVDYMKL